MEKLVLLLIIINVITFCLYGIDKFCAIHKWSRVPEIVLLGFSIIGGCFGGLISMYLFHHKTRKWYFKLINCLFICVYAYLFYKYL